MASLRNAACFLAFIQLLTSPGLLAQSPYRLDTGREIALLAGGVAAWGSGTLLQNNAALLTAEEVTLLRREDVPAFDRAATYNYSTGISSGSDVLVGAIIVLPTAMLVDGDVREDLLVLGTMYAENVLLSAALPAISKGIAGRIRPYAYNENVPSDVKLSAETKRSFFSGHTTFAFSSAVFFNVAFGDYFPESPLRPWLWGGGMAAAGAVGAMRVLAGKHFLSDVLAGAAVGSAIGILVPALHRQSAGGWSVDILPLPEGVHAGLRYAF